MGAEAPIPWIVRTKWLTDHALEERRIQERVEVIVGCGEVDVEQAGIGTDVCGSESGLFCFVAAHLFVDYRCREQRRDCGRREGVSRGDGEVEFHTVLKVHSIPGGFETLANRFVVGD